ncbi:MAG: potassium transporter, partial [Gammaproteobacteria bacterium]|nr:potassium transporter [Gammaproteobacteria bacterium]
MNLPVVSRILGMLLGMFSLTMIPPMAVSWLSGDDSWLAFLNGMGIILVAAMFFWLAGKPANSGMDLRLRDGFLIVALFWVVIGVAGSAPLIMSASLDISVTDAIFESISGLTTTGATILTGLDDLPRSILFYRQMLQWLGGMGIIVLAVAVLPMLGVGGMQLYRAETPGPVKDHKLTP